MCLELVPLAKVIRWIIARSDVGTMIISNTKGQAFASFTPSYTTKACKLLAPQTMMSDEWINNLSLDYFECTKRMMLVGKILVSTKLLAYAPTT